MPKKRAHGEGSIHQLPSGRWRGQLCIDGRRISFSSRSINEVKAWIRKTEEQIEQGLTYQAARMTVGEYLENWLASVESSVRKTTFYHYKYICKKYLIPATGKVLIKDLTSDRIQNAYDRLGREGIGPHTIIKAHTVLHNALARAEETGLIIRNMANFARPPQAPHEEMKIWTGDEARQFLTTASNHRLYTLFYLALSTGMRQMELLGLKWQDFDELRGILHVQRQLSRSGGSFLPLKTKAGKRSIKLSNDMIRALKNHNQLQLQERDKAGDHWKEMDLTFTSTIGSPITYKNMMDRDFKPLIRAAGLPAIRFHDLRHTAASLMLSKGVPIFIVSKILGHARPSITSDIYGHLVPGSMDGIGDMMDELIAPIQVKLSL